MGKQTTTVAETREVERTVTYCDICGGTDGSLTESTDEDGTTRHFHSGCIQDVTVDSTVATPNEQSNSSKGLRARVPSVSLPSVSVPTPTLSAPPVLTEIWSSIPPLTAISVFAARLLAWPVIGLWIADEVDVFGGESLGAVGEYFFGLMISLSAWACLLVLQLPFA